jgi:signal transduction histidine kinase
LKTLKSKILAGLLFLLILILSLSLTGIFSVYFLSSDSNEIIKDNYASLGYCTNMLNSLENIFNELITAGNSKLSGSEISSIQHQFDEQINLFEKNFRLQQNNITEPGEGKLVSEVTNSYEIFKKHLLNARINLKSLTSDNLKIFQVEYLVITKAIKEVYKINHQAVYNKSKIAHKTADKVSLIMAIATVISILLTVIFIIYFPAYLTFPVIELTKKIDDISNRRYDQKIEIKSNDEFKTLAEAFNKMAVKLKDYEAQHIDELILEKRRIETLVANLQDGSLLLDKDYVIVHVNNKFCELTKLSMSDLIGKKIYEVQHTNEITETLSSFKSENISYAIQNMNKRIKLTVNNRAEYFQILLLEINKPVRNELLRDPSGYIILIQNVTSFEERDLAKTNLIATISHELKTPLSSINLSIKLLEDARIGSLNDEQKELINSVKLHSARILNIVNEVLDFTQAETGQIKLTINSHSVGDIIELGSFAVLMLLNEKGIGLEVSVKDKLPNVKCDIEKTVWVIVNLLNNAIRYSEPKSKINISVELVNNFVQISVRDFGQGISVDEQNKIFEKYVTSKSKFSKGTGLGLAIAKEFVEVQGGKIWVESTVGKGSNFYFTLPIA